jgi:tetratricopeptide (TPR) repeat protein
MVAAERFESGLGHLERALALAERERLPLWPWRLRRSLALAYLFDGRFEDAIAATDRVIAEIDAVGESLVGPDVFLAARMLRDVVNLYCDNLDQGVVEAEETFAMAVARGNRTMQSIVAGLVASTRLLRGEFAEAHTWALRGLELAEIIGSRSAIPNLAALAILASHSMGAPIESARLDQIETGLGSEAGVQQALRFVVDACLAAGDVARAERIAETVRRRSGGRYRQAYCAKSLADVAVAHGRDGWQRAASLYAEAVGVARAIGARSVLATTLLAQARLLGLQTRTAAALAALDEAMPLLDGLGMRWHVAQGERLRERLVGGEPAVRGV